MDGSRIFIAGVGDPNRRTLAFVGGIPSVRLDVNPTADQLDTIRSMLRYVNGGEDTGQVNLGGLTWEPSGVGYIAKQEPITVSVCQADIILILRDLERAVLHQIELE